MKRIIFCNSLAALKTTFSKYKGGGKYLLLDWNKRTFKIKRFLDDSKRFQEISIKDYSLLRDRYLKEFVGTVANVNVANHRQYFWWGLNFANKNPLITPLCDKIFFALLSAKIIDESLEETCLFIIGRGSDIAGQLKIWFAGQDVKITIIRSRWLRKNSLKDGIRRYTPVAVFFAAFRAWIRKIQVGHIKFDPRQEHVVALSLLNHQSFRPDGSYYDTYFGKFVPYAAQKSASLINLFFVNSPRYGQMMKKIRKTNPGFVLMPLEYFLSVLDIFKCLLIALKRYFFGISLIGQYTIGGRNVNHLINVIIRRDFVSTYFYDNLRFYHEVRNFVRKVNIKKFYYPFENQSIEKLLLLAVRGHAPEIKTVGYQHPSLSMRHTNFQLTRREAEITPLPDRIVTMGDVTKDFMVQYGNFPDSLLARGCALRQRQYLGALKAKRQIRNILVILATNSEEYIKVMAFLEDALKDRTDYKIWIRPHPVFPFSEAVEIAGEPKFPFYLTDKETLDECIAWADIALYVHSTASIESLSHGLPVVCLNIDNVISPDPLFSFTDFRWRVDSPEELIPTIHKIDALSQEEFYARQKRAVEYTGKYFYPVNERNMDIFLNV